MALIKYVRKDVFEGNKSPFISITNNHFHLNAEFVNNAKLNAGYRVNFEIDDTIRRLIFVFHKDDRENSFTVFPKGIGRKGLLITSRAIINTHKWIKSVARLEDKKDRRFTPKRYGKKWYIDLRSSFEFRDKRESMDIASDITGIYRYRRMGTKEEGKIVYIGRGIINDRLLLEERKVWDYDIIEYSVISNKDDQDKWEDYWIERYKEANEGKLPFYNKQSGSGKFRD